MRGPETLKVFGLGLAATLLLFLAGVRVPFLGLVALPLVVYPSLFVGVRAGKEAGQLLPLAAAACIYALAGLEAAAVYLAFALVAFALFHCFGRGWSITAVVSGSALFQAAVMALAALAFVGSFSSLWRTLHAGVQAQVLMTLQVYERIGLSGDTVEYLRDHAGQMAALFVQMLPGMTFFVMAVVVLANLALLLWQFPQYRSFFFQSGDLREWKSPDRLVWVLLAPSLALFLPLGWPVRAVAVNLVFVCLLFYFFQGLAIVAYYFHRKRVPMFFRVLGYLLIVFEQFLTVLVIGLGFFDLWGDFRRLERRTTSVT